MSDNKVYYYMRLKEGFFESDELIILESMENGYIYSNILLKLYLRSLKRDGKLMLNETIPYNAEILAKVTGHDKYTVQTALQLFEKLGLVEILDSGAIYMLNIQSYIGKSSTEADRKREYRERIEKDKCLDTTPDKCLDTTPDKCLDKSTPEIEIEKEIEERRIDYQQIADMYNDTCVSFPRLTKLSDSRKKAIKARLHQYTIEDFKKLFEMAEGSSFLKGQNNRDWSANFDWLIKDANMAKVLDGNYADKKGGDTTGTGNQSRGSAADFYEQFLGTGDSD